MSNMESGIIRTCLLYEYKLGNKATEAARRICMAFGDNTISQRTAQQWFKKFNESGESIQDAPRSGRPKIQLNIDDVKKTLKENPKISCHELSRLFSVSCETIRSRLHQSDIYWKKNKWIQIKKKKLTQKQQSSSCQQQKQCDNNSKKSKKLKNSKITAENNNQENDPNPQIDSSQISYLNIKENVVNLFDNNANINNLPIQSPLPEVQPFIASVTTSITVNDNTISDLSLINNNNNSSGNNDNNNSINDNNQQNNTISDQSLVNNNNQQQQPNTNEQRNNQINTPQLQSEPLASKYVQIKLEEDNFVNY